MLPTELRAHYPDGTPYTRREDIQSVLCNLLDRPREAVLSGLHIRDRKSADFLPSECLVHLIRQTRSDNSEAYFDKLYRELMRRFDQAMFKLLGETINKSENVDAAWQRDRVRDVFLEEVAKDRQSPGTRLDYYEVNFDHAVAASRRTALFRATRDASRHKSIEYDDESGEPTAEVEQAFADLKIKDELYSDDPIYRTRVAAAISALPDKERKVIAMLLMDIPLSSTKKGVDTISKRLNIAEKTARNRRNSAYNAIRKALNIGTAHD